MKMSRLVKSVRINEEASSSRIFEEVSSSKICERENDEEDSSRIIFDIISRDSCKNFFNNIFDSSCEDLHKASCRKTTKEEYGCFKSINKEDDIEVISLTYDQIFKLSIDLSKQNNKIEKSIKYLEGYIEFLENSNKSFGEKIANIRNQYLKLDNRETCGLLKNEVTSLHKTLSNKKISYNKKGLRYKPNK